MAAAWDGAVRPPRTLMLHRSLGDLVDGQAEVHGGRPALSFEDGTRLSYADLAERVARARGLLAAHGVGPGSRVAMMLKNSLFFPTVWLGVTSVGAVAVPVNSRLGPDDAGYIIRHSGASLVLCDDATVPAARAATERADPPSSVLEVPAGDHQPEVLARADPRPAPRLTVRVLANVQYTSGTTGFPKGCLLTHGYWQRMGAVAVDVLHLGPRSTAATAQPFSYIDPMWNVVATLQAGAHLVVLEGFHPSSFMERVVEHRVTVFYCVGVMPTLLLKQPPASSDHEHVLERVECSAIPPGLHRDIEARWGVPWFEAYGMTETGINIAVSDEDHDALVGSGSIGRALPHCEASVADEAGRDAPPGDVGELRLRGPGFMEGYLDDPEATAAFFRGGWANTGDLARVDDRGFIRLEGRKKEMIRRGGENISQAEVEYALRSHDAVLDCAVAPVPDDAVGEEAKAYVVLVPGRTTRPEELRDFLTARLAPFKVPRYWEFRQDLPRTPSERIAKSVLEEGRPSWREGTFDARSGAWL